MIISRCLINTERCWKATEKPLERVRERKLGPRILSPAKLSFEDEGEIGKLSGFLSPERASKDVLEQKRK